MPIKSAKRAISVPATPAKTVPAVKPAKRVINTAPLGTAANAQAARSNVAKPAPAPASTAASKPAVSASAAKLPVVSPTDTAPRGLTRDAAGIVRYATNYNQYSGRDDAYLAFFGNVMRKNNHAATLRQIHDAGVTRSGQADRKRFNPNYTGSGKATDVGAINRLCKAGHFTRSADGNTLTATALARASKAYLGTN